MANPSILTLPTGDTAYLYRAAIGSRAQDYYLAQFGRFDFEGKTSASWNWAAYWSTINWLIFRRMWGWLFAYAGALLSLILLVFGVGKIALSYSDASAILLLLVLLTAVFVVPGLYGNAWFYTHSNDRITSALRTTQDLQQAAGLLAADAPTPRRLVIQSVVNAVLFAAALAVYASLPGLEGLASASLAERVAGAVQSGKVNDLSLSTDGSAMVAPPSSAPVSASQPVVSVPGLSASAASAPAPIVSAPASAVSTPQIGASAALAPAAGKASAPATAVSAPVPGGRASAITVPTPAPPARVSAPVSTKAPAPAAVASAAKLAPASAVVPTPSPGSAVRPQADASKPRPVVVPPTPKPVPAPAADAGLTGTKAGAAAASRAAASATAPAAAATSSKARLKWLVQVGAYAQAENASNVLSQVQGLGLDARSEPIPMSSGQMLTRVVVGPYDVQSEAEQAMLRIKALDLPVVILRQR